jgi:lytic murein transglycosylase
VKWDFMPAGLDRAGRRKNIRLRRTIKPEQEAMPSKSAALTRPLTIAGIAVAVLASSLSAAFAQNVGACRAGTGFDRWLSQFRQDAVKAGVSQRAISATAPYLVFDQGIVNRDRGQRVFGQIFTTFSDRMAAAHRVQGGQQRLKQYANVFARAEREYGVPPAVIAAFWGLETDFGGNSGKLPVLKSLATLAYDCRRADRFHEELIAALKIVDRGDLSPEEMIGSWAGELGQMQFLPRHYFDYAVDFDGDGRRDLIQSAADAIGSTAHYISSGLKWRRGEPWLQEVRVPSDLPWDQTDLSVKHPRSKWAQWGVTYPDGRPLPNDNLPASVLLPMGKDGPAFLAYANFAAYTEWNNSLIYSTTAGYLATRIAGAPPMRRPQGQVAQLSFNEIKELQQMLSRAGFNVGKVDGVLGQQSRIAVKTMQTKYGLPADAWPTAELLGRMRAERGEPPAARQQPRRT